VREKDQGRYLVCSHFSRMEIPPEREMKKLEQTGWISAYLGYNIILLRKC
jgi:hypothetical protein